MRSPALLTRLPAPATSVAVLALLLLAPPGALAEGDAAPVGPRLVLEGVPQAEDGTWRYSFGEAAQEQELSATFTIANTGDRPVTGLRAVGDCGCYGVTLSSETLAPGEKGTVGVIFRTLLFAGEVTKRLRLYHEGGPVGGVVIRLHIDVVAGVVLDPGRIWFGDVLVGATPSQTVVAKWHEKAGRPFEVTAVEVPGYDLAVTTAPYAQGPWKGTAVTLAFKEPPPLGMFSATALLRTNHPDYPRLTLALTANVTGKVWVQSRVIYFGWVPRGTAKTTSLLVRPYEAGTALGAVTAQSRAGRVAVTIEKHPRGGEDWWRLVVSVSADAKAGTLDDVIEVRTEVPGEEVTEIAVKGEVLAGGS